MARHDVRKNCRLCGSGELVKAISLSPTPPANAFAPTKADAARQERFPLNAALCNGCGHMQLVDVVDPSVLFEDYVYVSGTSSSFVAHFDRLAAALKARFKLNESSLVVDIGSNDGTLLRAFDKLGLKVLGVDPAKAIAAAATASGIETLPKFMDQAVASKIIAERGPAHVVTANNVFAHTDDMRSFVQSVRTLLDDQGIFVFEVSYLVDVVEKTLFDTIYHEHLAYHSVAPLVRFFEENGMTLFDVERISTHGGSLRGYACKAEVGLNVSDNVVALCQLETDLKLREAATYHRFTERVDSLKKSLVSLVDEIHDAGGSIAAYGAPAKATTLLYHFGLESDVLDFVVDDSPLKRGLFLPGTTIPVVGADVLYDTMPEYLVLLAWNFAAPIMEKHEAYGRRGGKFIIPVPQLEVV